MNPGALLLSIRPEHADKILGGEKTVELRRRRPRLGPGSPVIVYVSSPVQSVVASLIVDCVIAAAPRRLWRACAKACGLTRAEFNAYFSGAKVGFGIVIRQVARWRNPVSLEQIRDLCPTFCPPQGYYYLEPHRSTDAALRRRLLAA